METTSPALADAYALLRQDIQVYLDEAEYLATKHGDWASEDIATARDLIPDLTTIVRGILVNHKETPAGACPTCATNWPCTAVTTIHRLVKDPTRTFIRLVERAHR